MPRTIKRYSNRKLYDTSKSCYVTLDEVADLVKEGEEVRIIDNNSKEDLTAVTLAQIVFDSEKRRKPILPLSTLRTLIQSGGELIEKTITRPVANIRQETEKRVTAAREAIHRTEDDARDRVNQFVETTQKTFDELQKKLDERLRSVVPRPHDDDIVQLVARLDALEARVAELEAAARRQGAS